MKQSINEIKRMQQLAGMIKESYGDNFTPDWSEYDRELTDEDKKWLDQFYNSVDHLSSDDEDRKYIFNYLDKMHGSEIVSRYKGKYNLTPDKAAKSFADDIGFGELKYFKEADGAGGLSSELQLAKWALESLFGMDPGTIETIEPGDEPLSYKITTKSSGPEKGRVRLAKLLPGPRPKLAGKPEIVGQVSQNEGHYWDTEINKDLKTGQKIPFGDGEKTAHNILDLNKNPELKKQVQVGDLVYNTLGKRWVVSKIEGDKISLRTLDSVEYGAADLTV